jgi:hypothetical protein
MVAGQQERGRCPSRIDLVELLCFRCELLLDGLRATEAEAPAREALRLASQADFQFAWGAAQAGHLAGQALIRQGRSVEARPILEEAHVLRLRISDPRAKQTENLIKSLK